MRKIILTAALAATTVGLFAQGGTTTTTTTSSSSTGLMSKKGEVYLPEAGDWAISFSATPFLNYFGGFLSNAGAVAPSVNFLNATNTIIGKYYVDNQTAYRGLLRIGITSLGQDNLVTEDGGTSVAPQPLPTKVDHANYSSHFIGLGAGYEKRRGHTRLQGYYGGEFMFYLSGSSNTYTYGNAYSATYQAPESTVWAAANGVNNGLAAAGSVAAGNRVLSQSTSGANFNGGSTFGINLDGFIGFEYFFMPKISVGGEYTWGINFASTTQGSTVTEVADGASNISTTVTTNTGGSSAFSVDSGLNSVWGTSTGSLYITFHF